MSEKFSCRRKRKKTSTIDEAFSPYSYCNDETWHFSAKKSKIKPFVVKSVLDSNCKRFRRSTTRENFNLKADAQKIKTHSINDAIIFTNTMKKGEEYPISFSYVLTTFQHQVQDLYPSQTSNFFLVCPRYKHIFGTSRATNEQLLFLAPLKTYKKRLLRRTV